MELIMEVNFENAQKSLFCPAAIPVVGAFASIAQVLVSLAQIVHGLAMAAICKYRGESPQAPLSHVRGGAIILTFAIGNIATLGLLGFAIAAVFACKKT